MNFLGINAGHGASCALMINGMIKLVYQEERFKKIKNFGGYPRKSIENCLKYVKQKNIIPFEKYYFISYLSVKM